MIIERYVVREIVQPVIGVCGVLVTIFASYLTARFLGDAVDGLLPPYAVGALVGLRALIALEVLLPIALFLAVVMALGRLHSDGEMVALAACGVSPGRVLRAVTAVALVTAAVVGPLSLWGRPWAYDMTYRVRARAALEVDLSRFQARRFYEKQRGDRVVFAERLEAGHLEGVFVQSERDDTVEVTYAERARQRMDPATGEQVLVAEQGRHYRLSPPGEEDRVVAFNRLEIPLRERDFTPDYRRKAASVSELVASGRPSDLAELQWRLTAPLGTLFLALLGVPLSRAAPRRGRYARFGVAVVAYAVYYNVKAVAKTVVEHGWVGTVPGLWWVDLLLAALVIVVLRRRE